MLRLLFIALLVASCCPGEMIPVDVSEVKSGPIAVEHLTDSLTVHWRDESLHLWTAQFSLDSTKPLITGIDVEGQRIVDRASPVYRCSTGRRRGGWDAFFDFPPSAPEGTRSFLGEFAPKLAKAKNIGDRLEVSFQSMRLGIFTGSIQYTFYPGSRLVLQEAVMKTKEPDVAYFYDAGLKMTADADRQAGLNMDSQISYFDPNGIFTAVTPPYGSEWHPLPVRYRAIAARSGSGSVAVFPPPHRYFFARDYTSNLGYVWHSSWRGAVSLGIRQLPDDNSPFYPWMNAPPDTEQHMGMFLLLDALDARHALDDSLRYTHRDRFPELPGYQTFAPHWHLAYTVQAMEKGLNWEPPFKRAMKDMGLNAAMIMDFHAGDGHPSSLTEVRLQELQAFYKACRAQSDSKFLLIPAEEANTILGGHWGLVFPKPVYWFMDRQPSRPFLSNDRQYGKVYRVSNPQEVWQMVKAEGGYVYQTHPRTKGSTGFPDKIRDTFYFKDPRYLGTGWKAMPSDLSSPRLGERAFKILDDMNNWGLHKRTLGEVDVFQVDSSNELYGHMNVNYVRLTSLPTFEHYFELLDAVARGNYFTTTGEILLPITKLTQSQGDNIHVSLQVSYTFPLQMAEVVWGNGSETLRKIIPLTETRQFTTSSFSWDLKARNWKWVRLAVWDVAGNGAFVNPIWKESAAHAESSPSGNLK